MTVFPATSGQNPEGSQTPRKLAACPPSVQRALTVQNLLLAKFTPPHPHSATLPSLLLVSPDRPQALVGGGPGLGIHSIMKLLILVSSTAVSKPVFSLSFLHLPWRRKVHRSNRVDTQLVMTHIIR